MTELDDIITSFQARIDHLIELTDNMKPTHPHIPRVLVQMMHQPEQELLDHLATLTSKELQELEDMVDHQLDEMNKCAKVNATLLADLDSIDAEIKTTLAQSKQLVRLVEQEQAILDEEMAAFFQALGKRPKAK